MAITQEDITLTKFLKLFTTTTNPEAGKIQLPNEEFVKCAALLKISQNLERITERR